jgi:hypothetical protein
MSRSNFVLITILAGALILLLGVAACAPVRLNGGEDMNMPAEDGGIDMNAMEVDTLPPAYGTAEPPPPPPPEPAMAVIPASEGPPVTRPHLRSPATDTAAEGPEPEADNRPFRGLGAFVKPPVWKVGNAYSLEFVVGQNEAGLQSVGERRAVTTPAGIWMAPTMRVTLDPNPNFEIAPQNPDQEIQDLSPDRTAAWFWNVKPLKPGTFTLVARVQALKRGPDGELVKGADGKLQGRFFPPQTVDVQVRVGARDKAIGAIGDATTFGEAIGAMFGSWQKMLAALAALITAAGTVWAALRKFQGKPIRPRRLRRK